MRRFGAAPAWMLAPPPNAIGRDEHKATKPRSRSRVDGIPASPGPAQRRPAIGRSRRRRDTGAPRTVQRPRGHSAPTSPTQEVRPLPIGLKSCRARAHRRTLPAETALGVGLTGLRRPRWRTASRRGRRELARAHPRSARLSIRSIRGRPALRHGRHGGGSDSGQWLQACRGAALLSGMRIDAAGRVQIAPSKTPLALPAVSA